MFKFKNKDARATSPFLYPLKTSENLWFSDVFKGYKNGDVVLVLLLLTILLLMTEYLSKVIADF